MFDMASLVTNTRWSGVVASSQSCDLQDPAAALHAPFPTPTFSHENLCASLERQSQTTGSRDPRCSGRPGTAASMVTWGLPLSACNITHTRPALEVLKIFFPSFSFFPLFTLSFGRQAETTKLLTPHSPPSAGICVQV